MSFIASMFRMPPRRPRPPIDTVLDGPRLLLRAGDAAEWRAWRTMREVSREYLVPWEPQWPADALSYGYYCSLLRRQWREWRAGRGFAFTIFVKGNAPKPVLAGGITLGDIVYAAAQKGTIGYWLGKPYTGQGYMTEAVGMVCDFAFDILRLQRVEASCMPSNEASKTVLRRAGFEEEGFAKAYLQINGQREDHILWGRMKPG
ncbi:MAG: GNAT family N-acetyltransferase [Alphaproteobacteria bacterium]|nr:GNAT family N-acetyltransferase [Alphaproteobacteria bacterium]